MYVRSNFMLLIEILPFLTVIVIKQNKSVRTSIMKLTNWVDLTIRKSTKL